MADSPLIVKSKAFALDVITSLTHKMSFLYDPLKNEDEKMKYLVVNRNYV